MRCPLSGKICLLPKEIEVYEGSSGVNGQCNLHLCRLCGDDYLKQINGIDIVTKSFETITNANGITTSNTYNQIDNPVSIESDIDKIELKLQIAIKEENYEDAGKLRDILKELKEKNNG